MILFSLFYTCYREIWYNAETKNIVSAFGSMRARAQVLRMWRTGGLNIGFHVRQGAGSWNAGMAHYARGQ